TRVHGGDLVADRGHALPHTDHSVLDASDTDVERVNTRADAYELLTDPVETGVDRAQLLNRAGDTRHSGGQELTVGPRQGRWQVDPADVALSDEALLKLDVGRANSPLSGPSS